MPELQPSAKLKQKRWTPCKGPHNRSADRSTAAELLDAARPHTASWWGQRNEPSNLLFIPSLSYFPAGFYQDFGFICQSVPSEQPCPCGSFSKDPGKAGCHRPRSHRDPFIPLLSEPPSRCVTRATMSFAHFPVYKGFICLKNPTDGISVASEGLQPGLCKRKRILLGNTYRKTPH